MRSLLTIFVLADLFTSTAAAALPKASEDWMADDTYTLVYHADDGALSLEGGGIGRPIVAIEVASSVDFFTRRFDVFGPFDRWSRRGVYKFNPGRG
jgi:hypothetical protein